MTSPTESFQDRSDAGRRLAAKLGGYAGRPNTIVLALPRGGVPVALEVAEKLNLPLDVFIARKLGVPGHEELAMGAIASGGVRVINEEVVRRFPNAIALIESATVRERRELERRESLYRAGRPPLELRDCTVLLVDDGLATGSTMRAAAAALRQHGVARVVAAVPVGSAEACAQLRTEVDELVCLLAPTRFRAVGEVYHDFSQITDAEVRALLSR